MVFNQSAGSVHASRTSWIGSDAVHTLRSRHWRREYAYYGGNLAEHITTLGLLHKEHQRVVFFTSSPSVASFKSEMFHGLLSDDFFVWR